MNNAVKWLMGCKLASEVSELGEAVAALLDDVWCGLHRLEQGKLKKVEWNNAHHVAVQIAHQSLATFDGNHLTKLVVLSHDRCLRLEIRAKTVGTLELMFHQRSREGAIWQRMPTMDEHVASIREYYPVRKEE